MASMCESDGFTQKAGARSLDTQDHKENGQQKQWSVPNRITQKNLLCENVRGNKQTYEGKDYSNGAEKP